MDPEPIPLKVTARRFVQAVANLGSSEVGGRAKLMFAGLMALLCGLSGLNVVNNYVGRNFMTAIADRQAAEFTRQAILYVGVFAALTLVSVTARFFEQRLALLWRDFLSRRAIARYLADGTYYRLDLSGQLANPDQRISEDVRAFTSTTLSFVLLIFNASLTIVTFSGVLWSISPSLFFVAVLYAACGSYITFLLGRPLIDLNYDQLDKEAGFRSSLIHVRENAESVMIARGERRQTVLLAQRLDDLVGNFSRIISVDRNVGFFTTGYNWLIQIIPAVIIAPAFMRGDIEFGVITQSGAAFAMLVGAFSLIITQFNSISSFAAVVARLSSLLEAIERSQAPTPSGIEIVEQERHLAYEGVTLLAPTGGAPLLKDLSISIPPGIRVLLTGSSQAPGAALFRATAGLATPGTGRILRPGSDDIAFIQQRPYLPPGTLRQILVHPDAAGKISDDRILGVLRELNIEQLMTVAGGLDNEQNWGISLSMAEQQLLVFARALLASPRLVFMDRVETTLGPEQFHNILRLLSADSITCICTGEIGGAADRYGFILTFDDGGKWTWTPNPQGSAGIATVHTGR